MNLQEAAETLTPGRPSMKAMDTSVITAVKTDQPPNKIFSVDNVNFYYGEKHALKSINLDIGEKKSTAFIGPSGCGKTTLLRCLNRMNDLVLNTRVTGEIRLDGKNIYDPSMDVINLRRRVGMIFQKWNPFPKSIYENIVYGLRIVGVNNRTILTKWWRKVCGAPPYGKRSKIVFTRAQPTCPAASSSACASPARSRSSPTCCSWTSPARPSIRSPRRRSKS